MLVINLYTSRVILNTLGVVDYGINNVVAGVITMLGFITGSLGNATSRFITFGLGAGDIKTLKQTFGNILSIYLILIIIILVIGETVGLWFVRTQLVIPQERYVAALWIYQFSIFSSMMAVISAPYNAVIIGHERMSAFAYISILDAILKLLIVYLLQIIPFDKLIVYAILFFIIQCFDRILYGVYCAKHFEEVHTSFLFEKEKIKEIISFAGWTLTASIAVIGYTQGINILLNLFFGPVVNAARGVAVQVQGVCNQFCSNFLLAVKPQIIKSYAQNNLTYMHQLVLKSSRFAFYILFFIALPLSIEADWVLSWWLGKVPEHTANFLRLVLCLAIVRGMASPIFDSVHATGRLRRFQTIESSILLMAFPLAYVMLKFFDSPPEFALVSVVIVEIVAQFARISIVLPMINLKISIYINKVILPILYVAFLASIPPFITYWIMEPSLISSLSVCSVSVLSCCLFIYTIGCSQGERLLIRNKLTVFCNKMIRRFR